MIVINEDVVEVICRSQLRGDSSSHQQQPSTDVNVGEHPASAEQPGAVRQCVAEEQRQRTATAAIRQSDWQQG